MIKFDWSVFAEEKMTVLYGKIRGPGASDEPGPFYGKRDKYVKKN